MLFASNQLYGQRQENQLNEMIISSLNAYIQEHNKMVDNGVIVNGSHNINVFRDGLPRGFPYDSLNNVTFYSLEFPNSNSNPIKGKLKKGIRGVFVNYKLVNNQFIITISPSFAKRRPRGLRISVGEGGRFFYVYSCDNQEWELTKYQYGMRIFYIDPADQQSDSDY